MMVGMAVLVTVISIDASTITSISAAVTQPRCILGETFSAGSASARWGTSSPTAVPPS